MTHNSTYPYKAPGPKIKNSFFPKKKGWKCVLCCFLADLSSSRHTQVQIYFWQKLQKQKRKIKIKRKRFRLVDFTIRFKLSKVNNFLRCYKTCSLFGFAGSDVSSTGKAETFWLFVRFSFRIYRFSSCCAQTQLNFALIFVSL